MNQSKLEQAIIFAVNTHHCQLDKGNTPYIFHALSVMLRVAARGLRTDMQAAAVLHDVVEDSDFTVADIRRLFGKEVAEVVDALTRRKKRGEEYMEYIRRLNLDPRAAVIKLADLEENLRADRFAPDKECLARRYLAAKAFLVREGHIL